MVTIESPEMVEPLPQLPEGRVASTPLRRFPHPYRAALAICSDLDETPDADTYFELMQFLNTTEDTSMGPGVGLEVGNSIYFDMPPGHFSYWNAAEKDREKIRESIKSGHIDCLHSYGELATTRAHAQCALSELVQHGCKLKVWVDHAYAPCNLCPDIHRGHGDQPGHPAYHADLTLAYGIEYVWRGRVTSVIGQDRPFHFCDLLSDLGFRRSGQPRQSSTPACAKTVLKEAAKHVLARCGNRKYSLHAPNRILGPTTLRDGAPVTEFLRCNPHPDGVSVGDRGDRIHEVLTKPFLDRLVERQGVCILYTHLAKLGTRSLGRRRFPPSTIAALRLLAEYHNRGEVFVTSTARLLSYLHTRHRASGSLVWNAPSTSLTIRIDREFYNLPTQGVPSQLQGLTLYVPLQAISELRDERLLSWCNPPDQTGKPSITVPWQPLKLPNFS